MSRRGFACHRLLVVSLLAATASCGGETKCEKFCDEFRSQLIENFGIQPNAIDCSDPQWDTNDCQACEQILETDYGVQATQGLQACESL